MSEWKKTQSNWNRMHLTVSHDNACCATAQSQNNVASYKNATYGATEGEEGLDQLVL